MTLAYYEICLFPVNYESAVFYSTGPQSTLLYFYKFKAYEILGVYLNAKVL
jgi:hypothetical protein